MVVQTIKVINGNPFIYHYSDAGFYIERDGVLYADAIDLPQFEYRYTETTEPLEQEVAQEIATFAND
ncbi:hypothetical protein [Thermophilibacter provencensis]|uniref:hypothetical protein n=1 Tax=Thermophilibacter provencensis TaxID=1852386 RepID=UPI002353F298|nr:hypothetical protein [Thermophilibacter provencensis]